VISPRYLDFGIFASSNEPLMKSLPNLLTLKVGCTWYEGCRSFMSPDVDWVRGNSFITHHTLGDVTNDWKETGEPEDNQAIARKRET
jgi:hypothetical protein